jgi:hydroxymethylpyrimidine/phosphomethylpyrimidine kinase
VERDARGPRLLDETDPLDERAPAAIAAAAQVEITNDGSQGGLHADGAQGQQGMRGIYAPGTHARQQGMTPIALTIAGSDSGGGAGIQADLKTFEAFGVFGTTVITAVTAQNTLGVSAVHPVPGEIVTAQLDALAADLPPAALKTGMLATADLIERVAERIAAHRWNPYVLDPVLVATSGDRLLDAGAERAMLERLVPLTAIVTPNLHEAAVLTGRPVRTVDDMHRAGDAMLAAGAVSVLVKGGHLEGNVLTDVLVSCSGTRLFTRPRIETRHTHGTGCTLSASLTACLALGMGLEDAVGTALDYVARAIAAAPGLGAGHGPLGFKAAGSAPRTAPCE